MPHVFAYGSLGHDRAGTPARAQGVRRTWGVAMDNRVVVPGYKVWLDPADGRRPAVHVVFLDLEEAPGEAVDGVLVPVAPAELPALDRRERNYVRADVAGRLRAGPSAAEGRDGPVVAYVGSRAGRARARAGLARGDAVVARSYLQAVTAAFGPAIPPPPVPVRDLVRRDVPPPPPPASR